MTKQVIMNTIGKQIQEKRIAIKMTQRELACKANVSRTYLSDVENGRYMPSVQTLAKLAKVLEIDLNFLTK